MVSNVSEGAVERCRMAEQGRSSCESLIGSEVAALSEEGPESLPARDS